MIVEATARLVLGILDQSPVSAGASPAAAIEATVTLAQRADALGYRRYWLAEHHNVGALACSSPEILAAHVAATTDRIRVGAGGVVLCHHSPLKVAESFRLLEALHPGRIDLGVGRAPGGDAVAAAALSRGDRATHDEKLMVLLALLKDRLNAPGRHDRLRAMPTVDNEPQVWILAATQNGTIRAAEFGRPLAFAHHINPSIGPACAASYRDAFNTAPGLAPRVIVSVEVICADSTEEAERLAQGALLWSLRLQHDPHAPMPTADDAASRRFTSAEESLLSTARGRLVVGKPDEVVRRLLAIRASYDADELLLLTYTHDVQARMRCYELIADEAALRSGLRTSDVFV